MLNRLPLEDLVKIKDKLAFMYLDGNLKPFKFKGLRFYPEELGVIIKYSLNKEKTIRAPITLKDLDICISILKIEDFLNTNEVEGFRGTGLWNYKYYPKLNFFIYGKYNTCSYISLDLTNSEEELTFQLLNGLADLKDNMNGNLN